jgi:oligopeptide transport system substrate-binding protein
LDAVTNTNVEPLAVKLLAPYKDFRRATFGALTYYQFNTSRPPFDDPRVRRALALAVDRARLSDDTLEGATEPAAKFLPPTEGEASSGAEAAPVAPAAAEQKQERADDAQDSAGAKVVYDVARAQQLLTEAGYPGGAGFPRVRLLVNRNEQHRAVAQAVAAMWRNALGVETDIVLKNWDEYEETLRAGDYDVARRSIVMQTTDEESNVLVMFPRAGQAGVEAGATQPTGAAAPARESAAAAAREPAAEGAPPPILTEAEALKELPAMPLYFASSYALVKPYVSGFDANLLDAPSLQRVRIDTSWQPAPGGARAR